MICGFVWFYRLVLCEDMEGVRFVDSIEKRQLSLAECSGYLSCTKCAIVLLVVVDPGEVQEVGGIQRRER